jgi:hypothetical protein
LVTRCQERFRRFSGSTSAFITFVDRSATYYSLFDRLFGDPPELETSVGGGRGHGWFLRRYDRYRAMQFLGLFDTLTVVRIATISRREQQAAFTIIRQYSDQALTLTNAVGLHLMEARGIESCWPTDVRLGLTGVPLVIRSP